MPFIPVNHESMGKNSHELLRAAELGACWLQLLAEIDRLSPSLRTAVTDRILRDCADRSRKDPS